MSSDYVKEKKQRKEGREGRMKEGRKEGRNEGRKGGREGGEQGTHPERSCPVLVVPIAPSPSCQRDDRWMT